MSKQEVLEQLRAHLAALFGARFAGVDGTTFAKTQGFADGYMQALADLSLVRDRDLLDVVNEERREAVRRADVGLASIPPTDALPEFA